jgi:hypothetical protein
MSSYVSTAGSFDKVLSSCKSLGSRYQPNREALMPTALSALSARAQESLKAVTVARTAYRLAVNQRKESFAGISKLAVRIVRMVAASEGSAEHIADAVAIKNKLYPPKTSRKSDPSAQPGAVAPRKATNSKLYFDGKMETFESLIQIIEDIGSYNPNEADLKVKALKTKLADLRAKSQAVDQAFINFSNTRIERDNLFFGKAGIIAVARAVKNYIRGAFGATSRQSGQIGQLSS